MMPSSSSSSSSNQNHEPPTMNTQQQEQPFVFNQETIKNSGLHILTPHQMNCAVIVYDLSDNVSIKQLSEFFSFCGGVEKIVLNQNQKQQVFAVVVLENQAAFSTAVLLDQAILDDHTITVASYREFIGQGSHHHRTQNNSTNNNNNSKQSYLDHLQMKQTAYEKAISLIAMGFVTSQQALDEMKQTALDLDEQTKQLRQQLSESAQPIVNSTKMTWESTTQKLQPMLGAAKDRTTQVTAPVLITTKDKMDEMKEKINTSQVWENDTVKQGVAATNAAKEGLYNAGQGAWNAIKTSWFSFATDVKNESTQLKGTEEAAAAAAEEEEGSSSTLNNHGERQQAEDKNEQEEEKSVDSYFDFTHPDGEGNNQNHNNDVNDHHANEENLLEIPVMDTNEPSTSYTLGIDEDGDEYGVMIATNSPASPDNNQ